LHIFDIIYAKVEVSSLNASYGITKLNDQDYIATWMYTIFGNQVLYQPHPVEMSCRCSPLYYFDLTTEPT
jgi:hypothetical protein